MIGFHIGFIGFHSGFIPINGGGLAIGNFGPGLMIGTGPCRNGFGIIGNGGGSGFIKGRWCTKCGKSGLCFHGNQFVPAKYQNALTSCKQIQSR